MRRIGRPDEAERYFRTGVERLDRLGETGFNSTMAALLAHTLCDLERWDEAEASVERSREMSAPDDFASQAEWRMALARIRLAQKRRLDEALALAEEASEIVAPTDYLSMQAEAHEIRGDVLAAAGRVPEASEAFSEALTRYESKGTVDMGRSRTVASRCVDAQMRPTTPRSRKMRRRAGRANRTWLSRRRRPRRSRSRPLAIADRRDRTGGDLCFRNDHAPPSHPCPSALAAV